MGTAGVFGQEVHNEISAGSQSHHRSVTIEVAYALHNNLCVHLEPTATFRAMRIAVFKGRCSMSKTETNNSTKILRDFEGLRNCRRKAAVAAASNGRRPLCTASRAA